MRRRLPVRTFFGMSDETQTPLPARPAAAGGSRLRALIVRHAALIRTWVLFIGILGIFVAVSERYSYWTNHRFSEVTAQWMVYSMALLGEPAVANGIKIGCAVCNFTIIGECTAYYPCAIFISAVLAFPAGWRRKLAGIALGIPTILVINQVRLVSLCYFVRSYPEYFDTMHIVVWQSLIIFLTVLLWIVWVVTLAARR